MNPTIDRGLRTGALITATVLPTMMLSSSIAHRDPWAGMNAMGTALMDPRRRVPSHFDSKFTPVGLGVLAAGLFGWGFLYRAGIAAAGRRNSAWTGALSGLAGYAFDRWILGRSLPDRFAQAMGIAGAVAKYAVIALASSVG